MIRTHLSTVRAYVLGILVGVFVGLLTNQPAQVTPHVTGIQQRS